MEDTRINRHNLSQALRTISSDQSAVSLEDAARENSIQVEALVGAIEILSPFGIFKFDSNRDSVLIKSDVASDLLRSWSYMVQENFEFVDDWGRLGAECANPNALLDRGVCLLKVFEDKRLDVENPSPTRRIKVSKGIIKAESKYGDELYLMKIKEDSNRLQFIGGTVRGQEDYETTLRREINEELPRNHLKHKRDYRYSKIFDQPKSVKFVSPTYGSYREYVVNYYFVDIFTDIDIPRSARWVTHQELSEGETEEGIKTVPPRERFNSELSSRLRSLTLSTDLKIDHKKYHFDFTEDNDNNKGKDMPLFNVFKSMSLKEHAIVWGALISLLLLVSTISYKAGVASGG